MSANNRTSEYASLFDTPYLKKLILSLTYLGSWPHELLGEKKWFTDLRNPKLLFAAWSMGLILGMSYIKKNINNLSFFDQGYLYVSILMYSICWQRMTMTWTKSFKNTNANFFRKIHLFHNKNKNEFAMKEPSRKEWLKAFHFHTYYAYCKGVGIFGVVLPLPFSINKSSPEFSSFVKTYKDVEKMSSFICKLLHLELYIGITLYNLTPLYNNYRHGMFNTINPLNGTYEHAFYYDLPFDYTTKFNGFLVVCIVNFLFSYDIGASICIYDLNIFIILFHLWGHVKILKNNLKSFPRPEMKGQSGSIKISPWYTEEESRNITNLLIESIEYYKIIRKFMNEVSMAYGFTICYYFFIHQISGCILLMELSQLNAKAIGSFGVLTFTLFQQLIQMSIIFEVIGSQSETIKDAVYELPWECMDTRNRMIVLFYLRNVQNTMHLKALGILPVGVRTMASILKTSISYFMLLRTSSVIQD